MRRCSLTTAAALVAIGAMITGSCLNELTTMTTIGSFDESSEQIAQRGRSQNNVHRGSGRRQILAIAMPTFH